VHFPADQTCCGQPAHSSGFPEQTRAVALAQLRLFPEPWPVIVPSGSCAGMMRHHYPKIFADDPSCWAEARALADRIFELSEFLLNVAKDPADADQGAPARVALHTSCAARREMGTHVHARALLGQLPAVEVAMHGHESECCGFGGTFSLKHPSISSAMAGDKVDALKETGARPFSRLTAVACSTSTTPCRSAGIPCRDSIWRLSLAAHGRRRRAAMSARDNILQRLRAAPQGTPPLAPTCVLSISRAAPARQSAPAPRASNFSARRWPSGTARSSG
jgi:Fe-S oxidoreductase